MKLTQNLASEIIGRLTPYIRVPMNLMDPSGRIVASSDPARHMQVHEGAIAVMERGKDLVIDEGNLHEFPGTKKGVNLPIVHRGQMAGVVGLTGEPDEIMQAAGVTKASVEIALEQIYIQRQVFYQERQWENWLHQLLHPREIDEAYLAEEARYTLNTVMEGEWRVLVLQSDQSLSDKSGQLTALLDQSDMKPLFAVPYREYEFIIALHADHESTALAEKILQQSGIHARIGIGERNNGITGLRASYFEAKQALRFSGKDISIADSSDWVVERLIDAIPDEAFGSIALSYRKKLETLEPVYIFTLRELLARNFKIKETADALHIHRNTLNYRLAQIEEKTGLTPGELKDTILIAIILHHIDY
ncbi:CdaR family transcriptional regulator [Jeotgalibacillus malaysiensis]|uniref:CdaR family transcriptional regulator n=1 Tax=Jeotgalibacillus malaysiensis TaxID=1508404 RepID=UPI00384F41F5